ncbi:MAG TPA: recombinase family protein [Solirubrobacteraceae bacterium]|nr:recombinase family protein [Solirubrobacteraceae bacterium]
MDQYVRVSRVAGRSGESFISPDLQREQGAAWASSRGVEVAAVHEDLDQSGGKLERPGLDALLARIRAGQTDGVIVSKLDRLSRLGVADALRLVEQITEAGGVIAALDLGLDPTTPFGEFGMTIMLALARMERRRMSEAWEHAKTRALDRGARMGPTPFGYTRDDDGLLVPHPKWAQVVTRAFKVAADQGVDSALAYLRKQVPAYPSDGQPGVRRKRSADHRTWSAFTVRRLLRNRTYLGETRYGDRLVRDSHPALVDRVTFERAHPGDEKPQRRPAAVFPLSGFATCANCGEFLVGGRAGAREQSLRTYRCRASLASWKGERCDKPTNILAERLESYVVEQIRQAYEQGGASGIATSVAETDDSFEDVQGELEAAERELERFAADPTAAELLGEAAWTAALRTRTARVDAARVAYREHVDTMRTADIVIPPIELLDSLEPVELRTVLRSVFQTVRVGRGNARGRGPLAERVELVFHGEAPSRVAPLQNAT